MRHLILRRGVRTGELLVNVVTSSEEGFDEEAIHVYDTFSSP